MSSFALYAAMSNHQSQSHIRMGSRGSWVSCSVAWLQAECVCVSRGSGHCLIIASHCSVQPLKGIFTNVMNNDESRTASDRDTDRNKMIEIHQVTETGWDRGRVY